MKVTTDFNLCNRVSSKFYEGCNTYECLDYDRWGADWEKGRVAGWHAGRRRPWRLSGRPEIAPLLHYRITSQVTSLSWLLSAASSHRHDVMGRKQLNAMTLSHKTEPSGGETLWDCATLSILYFQAGKQAAILWRSVQATNPPLLDYTLPV